ncbi:MAG: efflux RND transporter permease subunit [Oligoflexia bacterium]|nr:efflux RND transporter permease subunit [Oligoflexia bacterium]
MNLSDLSIKRPIFITCVFFLILGLGVLFLKGLGLDLYPDVNFPVVSVTVPYRGAGPNELETLVAKPIEDQLSTLPGLKTLSSTSEEGVTTVIAEFNLGVDLHYVEQKVNERVGQIRPQLPSDIDDPVVRTFDPSDIPILSLTLTASLPEDQLFDLADQTIRPQIEQVNQVGLVQIEGGRKKEIQVELNEDKLRSRELSATQIVAEIAQAGKNTPAGEIHDISKQTLIRTLGDFDSVPTIQDVVVKFLGNEVTTRVGDVARVSSGLEDEKTRTYVNGQPALTLKVYRQSGANTVKVADAVTKQISRLTETYGGRVPGFGLSVVRDGARPIRESVDDVALTIYLGIALTIVVVLFFLRNVRSTLITAIAIPNSLLGAFILMGVSGFTLNVMSLMALSLAVGLLIDDAIVVRENIFRHMEMGEKPKLAASIGAKEVTLAVVATTLVVLSVFGPIAFLQGVVGQFFKQFGLTICFAMLISLFDSLTMAPMLSAYFAARTHAESTNSAARAIGAALGVFNRMQDLLEKIYLKLLESTLRRPLVVLAMALAIFLLSFAALSTIPKTFIPPQETGEFQVALDMPAGTSLDGMDQLAREVDEKIRRHPEVRLTVRTAGGTNGEPNQATIIILLKSPRERSLSTTQMKEVVRKDIASYSVANPKVEDLQAVSGTPQQPFMVNIRGENLDQLRTVSDALLAQLKNGADLKDVDTSFRPGRPELQIIPDKALAQRYGILSSQVGSEMRTLIGGSVPAKFRKEGREYDIRVRLSPEQRDLRQTFAKVEVPNVNGRLIPLSQIARLVQTEGPATIYRQNRERYIQISADVSPTGHGLAKAIGDVKATFSTGKIKLPSGVTYAFVGSAQDFQELAASVVLALVLAILFIYLVLSSLYESFFIPFTIMLVLPLAACGAFYGLAITRTSLDIFSMIGCILLLGVATKNSILLVDHIQESLKQGKDLRSSILESGKVRLRPILMTSFALIAGMLPVAIPVTESAKQRSSMGIAVIGGLISSTFLTLVVVPAAYLYVERFQKWFMRGFERLLSHED